MADLFDEPTTGAQTSAGVDLFDAPTTQPAVPDTPEEVERKAKEAWHLAEMAKIELRLAERYTNNNDLSDNTIRAFESWNPLFRAGTTLSANVQSKYVNPVKNLGDISPKMEAYWGKKVIEAQMGGVQIPLDTNSPLYAMSNYFRLKDNPLDLQVLRGVPKFQELLKTSASEQEAADRYQQLRLSEARAVPGYQAAFDEVARVVNTVPVAKPKNASDLIGDVGAGLAQFALEVAVTKRAFGGMGAAEPLAQMASWEVSGQSTTMPTGEQAGLNGALQLIDKIPMSGLSGKVMKLLGEMELFGGAAVATNASTQDVLIQTFIPAVMKSPALLKAWRTRLNEATTDSKQKQVILDLAKEYDPKATEQAKGETQAPPPVVETTPEGVVAKLQTQIVENLAAQKSARIDVSAEQSKARARNAQDFTELQAEYERQGYGATAAMAKARAALAGQLTDTAISEEYRPKLDTTEWDTLLNVANTKYAGAENAYTRVRVDTALRKLREGDVLQDNEIELMADLYGAEFARTLQGTQGKTERLVRGLHTFGGILRTVTAGGDISLTFRQLVPVLWNDIGNLLSGNLAKTGKWAGASWSGLHSFFSPKAFERFDKAINSDPLYVEARKNGLEHTALGEFVPQESRVEEFASALATKWPLIRNSNRAAVIAGNMARLELYKNLRSVAEERGIPLTKDMLTKFAKAANDLTGRSGLPKGKQVQSIANFANTIAFSLRFAVSRIKNTVTLFHTLSSDPIVRSEGFKTLTGALATTAAVAGIAKLFGSDTELNPLSADFLKVRSGNTHYDLLGGHGQVIRFMARMAFAQTKTQAGKFSEVERTQVIKDFAKSKSAPIVSLIRTLTTGKDYFDKDITTSAEWTKTISQQFVYLWLQDGIDKMADEMKNGDSFLSALPSSTATMLGSWAGISSQTYADTANTTLIKKQDELAQAAYQKNFDDLTFSQKQAIEAAHRDVLDALQFKAAAEHAQSPNYDFSDSIEKDKERGVEVKKQLSKESQAILDAAKKEFGFTLGVGRVFMDWRMNDERLAKYQTLLATTLDAMLKDAISSNDLATMPTREKSMLIETLVNAAKAQAAAQVMSDAENQ